MFHLEGQLLKQSEGERNVENYSNETNLKGITRHNLPSEK